MRFARYIVFYIITFIVSLSCVAQQEKIDTLKKVLLVLNDSPRINCRNALSSAYSLYKTDSAEIFAKQDFGEAQKDQYTNR